MIKTFTKERQQGWTEVRVVNLETGEFKGFNVEIINGKKLVFTQFLNNTYKMGYEKPKEFLFRAKEMGMKETPNDFLDLYPVWNPKTDLTEELREKHKVNFMLLKAGCN
ncbi:hypothetical protein [Brevibacillus sp. NRS-1366]|uniref:hypothetical protein n=1 Tax=Brevibacillus sp. NRS-1366 TaxID=3233899 RepID=UPI003D23C3D8